MPDGEERQLSRIRAVLDAFRAVDVSHYPRFLIDKKEQKIEESALIAKIASELTSLSFDESTLQDNLKQARESLDEVKALTEYEDQKATRLLTIVTIFVALAGFIFTRLADLYPYRAPIRDITTIHPMTPSEGLRNRQGERFRSFEVDDQLELGRLFDGEIGGLCAFQYFVGVGHCAAKKLGISGPYNISR
jgi:hypothetical protein